MAGIKHHLHQYLGQIDHSQGKDILERDFAFRSMQVPVFCNLCGQEVLDSQTDKDGANVDHQWEQQYGMHYRCYTKHMEQKRGEIYGTRY